MAVHKQKHDNRKINRIKASIQNSAQQGNPQYFEIWVDNIKVVPRTHDINRFDSYSEYVDGATTSMEIKLYHGDSMNNDKHIFTWGDSLADEGELNGATINSQIDEKLKEAKRQWDFEQLQKDHDELKEELDKADGYIEELEKKIRELENGPKVSTIGELGSVIAESMIRRNPQWLAKLPYGAGETLAGIIIEDNKRLEQEAGQEQQTETDASFSEQTEFSGIDPKDKPYVDFLRQLEQRFDQQQIVKVMTIIDQLANHHDQIDMVFNLLNNKTQTDA